MPTMYFNPFADIDTIGNSTSAATTKSVYFDDLYPNANVKMKVTAAGTWNGATLTVDLAESSDNSSFSAVSGMQATFTEDGNSTVMKKLGDIDKAMRDESPSYGKYLAVQYQTDANGDAGTDVDLDVELWVEWAGETLKLY